MIADVIIVGGGPAGSTAATLLARRGFEVTLLEREQFPREHVGESLLPFTYDILEDLGVLSEMEGRFSRKPGVTFSNVDGSNHTGASIGSLMDLRPFRFMYAGQRSMTFCFGTAKSMVPRSLSKHVSLTSI